MNRTALIAAILVSITLAACGGNSGSPPQSSATAVPSNFVFEKASTVSAATCPFVTKQSASWCLANWPPSSRGTVNLYRFTETYGSQSLERTAYVYVPASIQQGGSYPALIYLHGGSQSGAQMFGTLSFDQLADGRATLLRPETWGKNTSTCQYSALGSAALGYGGTTATGYADAGGTECVPQQAHFWPSPAQPFFVVYPNGVSDYSGNGDSWEDGRLPSPGQYDSPTPDQQSRDDVGFVDAVITQLKMQQGSLLDGSRIYLGGMSNGGVMVNRIMCNMDNPDYPELAGIAAFSVSIASMAANVHSGSNGMEQCPDSGSSIAPLQLIVGYDMQTPNPPNDGSPYELNCATYNPSQPQYPNEPGCDYPLVSGDGTMPYGTAYDTPGGTFTVNSPSRGEVIDSPDLQNFWLSYMENSGGGTATTDVGDYGFFTHYKRYTFPGSPAVFQVFQVDSGLHLNGGTRFDFSPTARIYDFLFAFSKSQGALTMTGRYNATTLGYGNVGGTY